MPLRNLDYMNCFWQQFRELHPKEKPPLIYSAVLYTGPGKWSAPTTLHDYLEVPEFLQGHVPQYAYDLIDLSLYKDNEIRGFAGLQLALLALKYVRSPEINSIFIEKLTPLCFSLLKEKEELEYIEDLLYYLSRKSPYFSEEVAIQELQNISDSSPIQEIIMTVAEKLRKRGKVEGKVERKVEFAASLLRTKFREKAEIWIPKLSNYGGDSLETIGQRILSENNLEKIFENLEAKTT